ncbi:tetratricopeptide repeat protein [Calditerrivibrio sp.]|uniref:tetratricopeptide repeat protein n=1 Tax=Calditerrivibrio sp. TaxID=2792612 RepID=UPI003D0B32D4
MIKLPFKIFILLLAFTSAMASSGTILIKESSNISEIILKIPPSYVEDYTYKGDTAIIKFNKKFNLNLKDFNKKVLKEITKNGNSLIVKANPWASIFVAKEQDQIRIVIANNPKGKIDINVNTTAAIPVEDQTYKNEESEKLLTELKNKFKNKDYETVITLADKLIEKNPLDKYGEEALFIQGLSYLELGKESDKALFSAASTLDEFTRKFPKSRLFPEAMLKSAETKEKLGFKNEAIYVYQEIIKNVKDEKYLNIAYTKIGELFNELGQPDKALKYFIDYLQKTKPENSPIYGYVGSIYAQKGDFEKASDFFSKYKPKKIDDVTPTTLYWMAVTYENKGDDDTALKLFTTFYNKYQDNSYTDMAMYKAGEILLKKGKNDIALDILKDAKNKFPQKKGGLLAAIKIAELTLSSKDPEFWSIFLNDAMKNNTDPNISMKATKLYIQSLLNSKRYKDGLAEIDKFINKFPDTTDSKSLLEKKEEILFNLAKEYVGKGDIAQASSYIDRLTTEFPKTKYLTEALKLKEEMEYSIIKSLYDNKKYAEALKTIEKYLTTNKNPLLKDRWYQLWEDTFFAYVNSLKSDPIKFGLNARQFITLFPNSNKVAELKDQIIKNLQKEFEAILKTNDYYSIIVFYQKNRNDLDRSDKREYYISKVAYALYMVGEKEKSAQLIKSIKLVNDETEFVRNMLNITPNRFNINNYNEDQFQKIISDLRKTNSLKAYHLSLDYNRNKPIGIKTAIDILENMDTEDKMVNIDNFLKNIEKQPDNIKKSAYRLYFKSAENGFISKNYQNAIKNYLNYLKYAPKDDPNHPEALYFLGKSYIAIGDNNLALKYLTDLTKRFPNNQYATLAKYEIEDIKWKRLKK